jgi:DNA-binding response OmpR family regulator
MAVILVVEDQRDLCNLLREHLTAAGHTVAQAFDGPTALALVEREAPHLMILDWMLPGLDGLAVCRRVRERHLMPILMLTARAEESDRVLGLEVGADDYVVKPFSMRELLARVNAILRRIALDSQTFAPNGGLLPTARPIEHPTEHGPLRVDPATRTASIGGAEIELTPKEFELLLLLAAHPGRAFSRDYLLARLWSDEYEGLDRTVDTHITRLRKKLGPLGERIVTVWGVGYRFMV